MTHGLLAVDPNIVGPGWIAFVIVMLLIGATLLLWRNMNHQLHKINVPTRASFEAKDAEGRTADDRRSPSAAPDDTDGDA